MCLLWVSNKGVYLIWLFHVQCHGSAAWILILFFCTVTPLKKNVSHNCYYTLQYKVIMLSCVGNQCLSSLRDLHAFIKSHSFLKGPSHVHLEGGISFGIGAFNLVCHSSILLTSLRTTGSMYDVCRQCLYNTVYWVFFLYRHFLYFLHGYSKF